LPKLPQMEDPKPDKDMRPRYKKIERVLQQAEEMAAKFVSAAAPRDLEHSTSLPVCRLLARVRLALADLRLRQVRRPWCLQCVSTPPRCRCAACWRACAWRSQICGCGRCAGLESCSLVPCVSTPPCCWCAACWRACAWHLQGLRPWQELTVCLLMRRHWMHRGSTRSNKVGALQPAPVPLHACAACLELGACSKGVAAVAAHVC